MADVPLDHQETMGAGQPGEGESPLMVSETQAVPRTVKSQGDRPFEFIPLAENNEILPGDQSHPDKQFINSVLFTHTKISALEGQLLEAKAYLYALLDTLSKQQLIKPVDIEQRFTDFEEALRKNVNKDQFAFRLSEAEDDKYTAVTKTVSINCEERYHLCHAVCCSLRFALTKQDVEEGLVKWDLGRPYMIRQNDDGHCTHLDRTTHHCGIHPNRPLICREYDCRNDKRIWKDFEKMIVSDAVAKAYGRKSTLPVLPASPAPQEEARSASSGYPE